MVSDTPPTLSAVLPTRGQVPGEEKRGFPPRAFASQDSLIPLGEGYSACPLFFFWVAYATQIYIWVAYAILIYILVAYAILMHIQSAYDTQ